MKGKKDKKITIKETPSNAKAAVTTENPDRFYGCYPSWRFLKIDKDNWTVDKHCFWDVILPNLKNFESMTWDEILRKSNNNHHFIDVSSLNDVAQKILAERRIEAESVMSLRFTGTHRLYGIMDDNVFNILWYDENHGDNTACVCRSHKKHT